MLANEFEERAIRDVDSGVSQNTWLDRVFAGSAAERVGISFRPQSPGVASFPVTTAGGSPAQRGRTEDTAEGTYTVAVSVKQNPHGGPFTVSTPLKTICGCPGWQTPLNGICEWRWWNPLTLPYSTGMLRGQ